MSNHAVISVENLGKTYRISHQAERQRYVALRDVIADKLQGLFRPRKLRTGDHSSMEDFWALKDVSFEVKQGEVLGIIGRNGAGKSTLLKILSRITEPSEGRVRIKGRVASLLEVGTGFHPDLTGRENVYLNGAILGMSRAEIKKKFDEIVAFAEVEKFLDTPVKRYSSGMYVRLAFAVAAHLEPEILIVDEVLAVGDAEFQKKCLGKMESVAKGEGKTILLVSHTLPVIRQLSTRVLLFKQGRLLSCGSPENVISEYTKSTAHNTGTGKYVAPGHPARTCFTTLEIKTSDQGNIHRLGEPLEIFLEVSCPTPQEDLWLSLQIVGEDGKSACFACYVDPDGKKKHHRLGLLQSGKHSFSCHLSSFPGYMGSYYLQAVLFNERSGSFVDLVENVCSFSTYVPSDFIIGLDWQKNFCSFLVPFKWTRS
jgi:lipopolysaccharide transport system ATP-binding protein